MVKVEGTLEELREIFANRKGTTGDERVAKARKKGVAPSQRKRTKSAWQRFMANPKKQIRFKSGKRKGRLDLKRMAAAYRREQRKSKR